MNRELHQKTTTIEIPEGEYANESQYVKYCGMEETTKLLNIIKFDSITMEIGNMKYVKK